MVSATKFFEKFFSLSEEQSNYFEGLLANKQASEGEYIIKQGEVCRKMIFLQKGSTVMVYERSGKSFIRDFIFENELASVYESFLTQKTARFALKTISDCIYQEISYENIQALHKKIPAFESASKKLTENIYLNMSRRFESLITLSAEERYLELLKKRPHLMAEVPQYMIASYLGITDVALSRIRKRISKKNQ